MPNHIWQSLCCGKLKYVHIYIDTVSGFDFASLNMGEVSINVIDHCLQAFNTMGLPKVNNSDDRPAYSKNKFASFL